MKRLIVKNPYGDIPVGTTLNFQFNDRDAGTSTILNDAQMELQIDDDVYNAINSNTQESISINNGKRR